MASMYLYSKQWSEPDFKKPTVLQKDFILQVIWIIGHNFMIEFYYDLLVRAYIVMACHDALRSTCCPRLCV